MRTVHKPTRKRCTILSSADLKFAADNIPAGAYPKSAAASNDGHITKFAAEALLARVYLFYTGYYGKEPQVEGVTKASVLQGLEDFYLCSRN